MQVPRLFPISALVVALSLTTVMATAADQNPAAAGQQNLPAEKMEAKLRGITLEKVEIVDAPLGDVLQFLRQQAAKQKMPVNIVNTLSKEQTDNLKITLSLQNVSLYDALRYIARIADLQLELDENAVLLTAAKRRSTPAR